MKNFCFVSQEISLVSTQRKISQKKAKFYNFCESLIDCPDFKLYFSFSLKSTYFLFHNQVSKQGIRNCFFCKETNQQIITHKTIQSATYPLNDPIQNSILTFSFD